MIRSKLNLRMLSRGTAVALALAFSGAIDAQAETVTLVALQDAMIFENNVNNGLGGGGGFFAGANAQPSRRRGLVSFDISPIPAGAIITSVDLRLVVGQIAGSGGGSGSGDDGNPTIQVRKLFVDWGEAATGANTATNTNLGGTGQGFAAVDGDVTWRSLFHNQGSLWQVPGGQFGDNPLTDEVALTPSASLVQQHPDGELNELGDISLWTSTPALVADVQSWIDDPSKNFGWMLTGANEVANMFDSSIELLPQTFRGFYSKDYNPTTPPTNLHDAPQLIVTYVVPEPSSVALLGIGLVLVSARWAGRRRRA